MSKVLLSQNGAASKKTKEQLLYSHKAEEAVLGSILIDGEISSEIANLQLTPEDFYIERHRWIFEAMLELHQASLGIDLVTLEDRLEQQGRLKDVGDTTFLMGLINVTPTSMHGPYYGQIVKSYTNRRYWFEFSKSMARWAHDDSKQPGDLATLTESALQSVQSFQNGQDTRGASWADLEQIIAPVKWAWSGWLPEGFMTLVVANSGDGKSNLILGIASSYLIGSPWPDGSPFRGETGKVLWCETEAAQVLNLDRAKKWSLPLGRFVSPLSNPLDNVSLDKPEHQAALYAKAMQPEVKLIVVDSFSGGTRKDAKASNQMGAVGSFLAELARDAGKPVLVSHHLRKKGVMDGDEITLDQLRDSSAIPQYARVVWAIDAPDAELKDRKRLYVIKNNLAKYPARLGFLITDKGLLFGEAPKPPRKETQADKAADLLRVLLAKEPKSQEFIKAEAEGAGISMPTINRAKASLNIVSKKMGTVWYWSLPYKG